MATTTTTSILTNITQHQKEAARLAALLAMYPDLTLKTNRRLRAQCSEAVNAVATDFEICYSCTCCPDAELYVRVFVETAHGRVYGLPYQTRIGERDDCIECPADGWDGQLRKLGIQNSLIDRLRERFENQLPPGDALDNAS